MENSIDSKLKKLCLKIKSYLKKDDNAIIPLVYTLVLRKLNKSNRIENPTNKIGNTLNFNAINDNFGNNENDLSKRNNLKEEQNENSELNVCKKTKSDCKNEKIFTLDKLYNKVDEVCDKTYKENNINDNNNTTYRNNNIDSNVYTNNDIFNKMNDITKKDSIINENFLDGSSTFSYNQKYLNGEHSDKNIYEAINPKFYYELFLRNNNRNNYSNHNSSNNIPHLSGVNVNYTGLNQQFWINQNKIGLYNMNNINNLNNPHSHLLNSNYYAFSRDIIKNNEGLYNEQAIPKKHIYRENYLDLLLESLETLKSQENVDYYLKLIEKEEALKSKKESEQNLELDNFDNNSIGLDKKKIGKKCSNRNCTFVEDKKNEVHNWHKVDFPLPCNKKNVSICDFCYKAFIFNDYCIYCGTIYKDDHKIENDPEDWIQCDNCEKWMHIGCEEKKGKYYKDMNKIKNDESSGYLCLKCREYLKNQASDNKRNKQISTYGTDNNRLSGRKTNQNNIKLSEIDRTLKEIPKNRRLS